LVLGAWATVVPGPAGAEVFWFFFSKKNVFAYLLVARFWIAAPLRGSQ
jgi:hypothetical protein